MSFAARTASFREASLGFRRAWLAAPEDSNAVYGVRLAHERLTRICFIDYDRQIALVADYRQ